jgi:AraC family transcriptional regulator of adaptative response/methylated-DNA-[protein]-cysteine methyltransferase
MIGSIKMMTPEEYRKVGADMVVSYSVFRTQFGLCLVASTDRGICNVLFADKVTDAIADLKSRWPLSKIVKKHDSMHEEIQRYFEKKSVGKKIKLHLKGTDFQVKVWKELLSIPSTSSSTYGEIARRLGDPKSSRAVGTAIGNNPIGYVIPCHRVLTSTGKIGGYRWGIERKKKMLGFEAMRKV